MPTDSEIADALKGVRMGNPDLCPEFDIQVKRAKNLTYLERLEYVAWKNDRLDLFESLKYRLEAPKVPEKGRWIKATFKDGSTSTFEVTMQEAGGPFRRVALDEKDRTFFIALSGDGWTPERWIDSWEYTEPIPVELEFGAYAVVKGREGGPTYLMQYDPETEKWYTTWDANLSGDHSHFRDTPEGGWITEIIERGVLKGTVTTVWKVGDVVPAGTVVGKQWSGLYEGPAVGITRVMNYRAVDRIGAFDRRIVWIEE